ncbi:MAG: hypothetical protein R3C60_12955 [Parvularculaceae bacterium]
MKQMMIDMMGAMMPYMKMPVWVGVAFAAVGLLLLVSKMVSGKAPFLGIVSWVLIAIGLFFIICQGMGMFLGMKPNIAFFANPREFDFGTRVSFWQVGLALLVPGVIFKMFSRA